MFLSALRDGPVELGWKRKMLCGSDTLTLTGTPCYTFIDIDIYRGELILLLQVLRYVE